MGELFHSFRQLYSSLNVKERHEPNAFRLRAQELGLSREISTVAENHIYPLLPVNSYEKKKEIIQALANSSLIL